MPQRFGVPMARKVDIPVGEVIVIDRGDGEERYVVTNVAWKRRAPGWLAVLTIEPYKQQADA